MTTGLGAILLLFSVLAYGGAGACLAVAQRRDSEEERDVGMLGVAALLLGFAVLCAGVLGGLAAVLAVGCPSTGLVYVLSAQRLGLFRVGSGSLGEVPAEESRRTF